MSMSEAFSVSFHALIKLCYSKALVNRDFPGGPVVKNHASIAGGMGFHSVGRELRSLMPFGKKNYNNKCIKINK